MCENDEKIVNFLLYVGSSAGSQLSNAMGECHDMHGKIIEQGRHYVPGPDICR